MHGTYTATTSIQKSDVLVAVGVRFDDRVTGDPAHFATGATVIHADVDPAEIGKVRVPEVPIVGDARHVLAALVAEWGDRPTPERTDWLETLRRWQRDHPLRYDQQPDGPIKPQYVVEELRRLAGPDAILVAGVGQHQMWAAQHWSFEGPRLWLNSGGLGTMGFAIPAAVGAKAGMPDKLVYAIDGDGCFQMTLQELITAAQEHIPVKIAVFNNGQHGMVTQWQKLFYEGRLSGSQLGVQSIDFVKLAEAFGCVGLRATTPDEVAPVIEKSLSIDDRPVVVEFVIDPDEFVWPMVPAGGSNDHILMGPEDL